MYESQDECFYNEDQSFSMLIRDKNTPAKTLQSESSDSENSFSLSMKHQIKSRFFAENSSKSLKSKPPSGRKEKNNQESSKHNARSSYEKLSTQYNSPEFSSAKKSHHRIDTVSTLSLDQNIKFHINPQKYKSMFIRLELIIRR